MSTALQRRGFLAACATGLTAGCLGSSREYEPTNRGVWPMSRYDPGGTNYVPDASGPRTEPTEKWSRQTYASARPPAFTVHEETLYFSSWSHFHALDTTTGSVRWSFHEGGPWLDTALARAPAYGDVMPIVTTLGGYLALNPSGGVNVFGFRRAFKKRWVRATVETGDLAELLGFSQISPPPVVADGTLYTVAFGEQATAVTINAATGEVRWTAPVKGATNARLAVKNKRVFVPTFAGNGLHALDAETGEHLWNAPTYEPHVFPPTATNDTVYCQDRDFLYAFEPSSGDTRWVVDVEEIGIRDMRTPLTATTNLVFTIGSTRKGPAVFAFDSETGDLQWRTFGGMQEVPPVVAGDTLYTSGSDCLLALDAESGERLWTHGSDRVGRLAIVGDTAYAVSLLGKLYALEGNA